MTDKEATVYVIDVGKSMGSKRHGRDESDLEWALKYVWDRLATAVGTGRKTLCSGVVTFRANETNNDLSDDYAYTNINVLQPLGQVLMPDLRRLRGEVKVSKTNDGDAISALVVAIEMIVTYCKQLKWIRRILLVTDGTSSMDADGVEEIVKRLQEYNIELTILGADFDDPEYGHKEEDKDAQKAHNENILHDLVDKCNGNFGTLNQAVEELHIPRLKQVRPIVSYKGYLTLGDPTAYETAMCIDVERYPRTMIAKAPTASSFALKSNMAQDETMGESSAAGANGEGFVDGGLTAVHQARMYEVKDENAPGGKRDVGREELAMGYEYGRTAVAISESDLNVTKLETKAGLDIVGFVPKESYDHFMSLDRSFIIIAQRTNEKAIMALSSFIHALHELDSLAVARLVTKDGKEPLLVLLAPSIEPDYECLTEVELPFAEDVRTYKFPPLDRVITISGKVLTEHRNLPTKDLQQAMDKYIDAMDISEFGKDDEGNPTEYMPFEDTFSPVLHRLTQAIRFRAINPNDPVPPPNDILTQYSKPPESLLKRAHASLETLRTTAEVKKVPPKALSRKRYRSSTRLSEVPRSGLDITALLSSSTATTTTTTDLPSRSKEITPDNAIPSFRQHLDLATSIPEINNAVTQLSAIIQDWIRHSLGDANYERAIEALSVMRRECIELEEPGLYNDVVREIKEKLVSGELGGEREEMWWKIRKERLGLIDRHISPVSEVSDEEAKEFLLAK